MKTTLLLQTWSTDLPPSTQLRPAVLGRSLVLSLGLALGFFCLQASAATVVVTAQNFSFTPSAVTIAVGDSVSFNNAGGEHNVTGYNPAPPPERFCGTALMVQGPMCLVTFTNTGVFQYRCTPHSSGSGTNFSGMIGSITVTSLLASASVTPGQSYPFPGGELTLSLNRTFNPLPAYQWQFNGTNLPGATGPTLVLSNLTTNDSGLYRVRLSNAFEVVTTPPATVRVVDQLTILSQPGNTNTPAGSNVTLSVSALSLMPIAYQWQRNSTNLPGATNASLTFTNVQFDSHTGYYRVLVSDTVSNVLSDMATLIVLVRPIITSQPVPQTVLQGGTAAFSVIATPDHPLLPLSYRWIRQGLTFLSNAPPTLVITNVQPATAGSFRVTIANLAGNVNSATASLTVLPDFDGDGMADAWEKLYGFDTNSLADALLDFDSDGMINRSEYVAGCNPTNAASVLKLQLASQAGGQCVLTFLAISNRTYSVEWNSQVTGGTWNRLQDVLAQPTDRLESVTDTNANGSVRLYRVVTPRRL